MTERQPTPLERMGGMSGLLGVLLAVAIAYYTGSAEGYFLPGIWMSVVAAVLFTILVLVRRPLVGRLRAVAPRP